MKVIVKESKWAGKFLNFFHYHLDNGKVYEVCSRKRFPNPSRCDAVDIIAFNEDYTQVCIVKENRIPIEGAIYSFPAGLREADEEILETATRELFEETGLKLIRVVKILPPSFQSPGMSDENVATVICIATGELTNSNATGDEEIEPMWVSMKEAPMLLEGNFSLSARCQMFLSMWSGYIYHSSWRKEP